MEDHSHLAEITVAYRTKVQAKDRKTISSSGDAYSLLMEVWNRDLIEYQEQFYMLCLNKANKIIGYKLVSTGGAAGTVVDVKQVFAIALKTNSSGIIVAHNHPSQSLQPSQADLDLTKRLRKAGEILDLPVLDHLIVTPESFYSFADQGLL